MIRFKSRFLIYILIKRLNFVLNPFLPNRLINKILLSYFDLLKLTVNIDADNDIFGEWLINALIYLTNYNFSQKLPTCFHVIRLISWNAAHLTGACNRKYNHFGVVV